MQSDTVYRYIGGSQENGILACGYMQKNPQKSQFDFCIPYYSVFLLLQGTGMYWDETGFTAPLAPGVIVQRLPNRRHSTRVDGQWQEFFVSLGAGSYHALQGMGLLGNAPVLSYPLRPDLQPQCHSLLEVLRVETNFFALQQAQGLAVAFFGQPTQNGQNDFLQQAKAMLGENLRQELQEKQVAMGLGLGVESFRKRFKQQTGVSPMAFRNQQKIMTAQLMLLGGASVKEVAFCLGYSDSFGFSKQFKKKTGVPPSRWNGT